MNLANKEDKLFGKILLIGIFSVISGFIVAFWIAGSSNQLITLFTIMLIWIITTLLLILVALVEDLNEELNSLLKEHIKEVRETKEEIKLLRGSLKRKR